MTDAHDVRITSNHGVHHVIFDGVDISRGLASATWKATSYGELAQVTLEVLTVTGEVDGQAVVEVSAESVALLKRLGWTPPPAELDEGQPA